MTISNIPLNKFPNKNINSEYKNTPLDTPTSLILIATKRTEIT